MNTTNTVNNAAWIRLHTGWAPPTGDRAVDWALWQPGYQAHPWPRDELRPAFTYYVCEHLASGDRGVVARATVTEVLRTTETTSVDDAHRLVTEELCGDDLAIPPEDWRSDRYNEVKAEAPWPQRLTAWRLVVEPVGPHPLPEPTRFPRSGWLRTSRAGW